MTQLSRWPSVGCCDSEARAGQPDSIDAAGIGFPIGADARIFAFSWLMPPARFARGLPEPAVVVSGKASGLASNTLVARYQKPTVPLVQSCAVRIGSDAPPSIADHRRSHGMIFRIWVSYCFPNGCHSTSYRHPARTTHPFTNRRRPTAHGDMRGFYLAEVSPVGLIPVQSSGAPPHTPDLRTRRCGPQESGCTVICRSAISMRLCQRRCRSRLRFTSVEQRLP